MAALGVPTYSSAADSETTHRIGPRMIRGPSFHAGSPRGQFRVSVFLGRELFSAYESHLFNIDTAFKKSDYSDFFLLLSSIPILVPGNETQNVYFMCIPTNGIAAGLPAAILLINIIAHCLTPDRASSGTNRKRQACYPHKDRLTASFSASYPEQQAAISAKVPDRIY